MDNQGMSKENVLIAYTGQAVDDGGMDIENLAFSLAGIGELFQLTNAMVNGPNAVTRVKVKSDFQKGSFEVGFDVVHSVTGLLDFFGSPKVSGAVNLITLIGLGSGATIGLIKFIKIAKDKTVKVVEELSQDIIKVEIGLDDATEIYEINRKVYELYQNPAARQALEKALSPLEQDGIDGFEVRQRTKKETKVLEVVEKKEFQYFKYQPSQKTLNTFESEVYLNLLTANFVDNNKWRFQNDTNRFFASMKDEDFLAKIDNGDVAFCKGDIFKVRLKTTQTEDSEFKVKNEYEVLEVIDHKQYKQLKLFGKN